MANPKKPALRLRVGGVYVDGDGIECRIVSSNPFMDQHGMAYDGAGRCNSPCRLLDLIREVSAPKPARKRKAAKPVMAWALKYEDGEFLSDFYGVPRLWATKNLVDAWRNPGAPVRVRIVEVRR